MVYEEGIGGRVSYPGDLICFEGADGTGKTTQAQILYESLTLKCPGAIERYPGGIHIVCASQIDPVVSGIRKVLFGGAMKKMTDNAQVALFLAYHLQLVDLYVRPRLAANGLVIMDRTAFSNQIYNLYRPNLDQRMQDFYLRMIGPVPSFLLFMKPLPSSWIDFFGRCSARAKQRGKVWHTTLEEYQNQIHRYENMISNFIAFPEQTPGMSIRGIQLHSKDSVRSVYNMVKTEFEFKFKLSLGK